MELLEPFRLAALPMEYSSLLIRYPSSKVLDIQWTKAGNFKVVRYEPGNWEQKLLEYPEPIPFY